MTQIAQLLDILETNRSLRLILNRAAELNMPHWYLGAGGIAQTVWNVRHGFDPEHGILDYDLVYYDAKDTSEWAQAIFIERGKRLFKDIPVPVDIVNEARVHLWYEQAFGRPIGQYASVEVAISTWPTTATSIGLREEHGEMRVFAPFGLDDLLNLIVRPNKTLITPKIYQAKVDRWTAVWPNLKIISWNEAL